MNTRVVAILNIYAHERKVHHKLHKDVVNRIYVAVNGPTATEQRD